LKNTAFTEGGQKRNCAVSTWAAKIGGSFVERTQSPSNFERSRNSEIWAGQFIDPNAAVKTTEAGGNSGKPCRWSHGMKFGPTAKELKKGGQFDPDGPVFHDANGTPMPKKKPNLLLKLLLSRTLV
jgi:hypothetical protein